MSPGAWQCENILWIISPNLVMGLNIEKRRNSVLGLASAVVNRLEQQNLYTSWRPLTDVACIASSQELGLSVSMNVHRFCWKWSCERNWVKSFFRNRDIATRKFREFWVGSRNFMFASFFIEVKIFYIRWNTLSFVLDIRIGWHTQHTTNLAIHDS